MNYLTKKEFKTKWGHGRGVYYIENGQQQIDVVYHTNTKIRAHECGHKLFNHPDNPAEFSISETFDYEFQAELFAFKNCGRKVSIGVLNPSINFATYSFGHTHNLNYLFNYSVNHLKSIGVKVDKNIRHLLWDNIKTQLEFVQNKNKGLAK